MLVYALICICLSLAGLVGLQFFYMIYLERIGAEHRKRIRELERYSIKISQRLSKTETRVREQQELLLEYEDEDVNNEAWADVIEES